jgi:hypothetical protein
VFLSLQADKGNCTAVLDDKCKLTILLESEVYGPLSKDRAAKLRRKYRNSSLNMKLFFL